MRRLRQLAAIVLLSLAGQAPASETITYSYDALGRVTNVAHSGTVNNGLNTAYSWDAADNRSNVTVTGSSGSGISFSIGNATAVQGNSLTFTVTKSGTTASTFNVNYATANGTAIAGINYTATSGTLTFLAADVTKNVVVSTTNTGLSSSKAMYVNLSAPSGGSYITNATGTGTITP